MKLCQWYYVILDLGILKDMLKFVMIGETLRLECPSISPVTWIFKNDILEGIYDDSLNKGVFIVKAVKEKHKGRYECIGTTDNADRFVSYVDVNIIGGFITLMFSCQYFETLFMMWNTYCLKHFEIWQIVF